MKNIVAAVLLACFSLPASSGQVVPQFTLPTLGGETQDKVQVSESVQKTPVYELIRPKDSAAEFSLDQVVEKDEVLLDLAPSDKNKPETRWVKGLCRIVNPDPKVSQDDWTILSPSLAMEGGCPLVTNLTPKQITKAYTEKYKEMTEHNRVRLVMYGGVSLNNMLPASNNTYYDKYLNDRLPNGHPYDIKFLTYGFEFGLRLFLTEHWSISFARDDIAPGRQEKIDAPIISDTEYVTNDCAGAGVSGSVKGAYKGHNTCGPATQRWKGSGDEVLWILTIDYTHHLVGKWNWQVHFGMVRNTAEWLTKIYEYDPVTHKTGNFVAKYQSKEINEYGPTIGAGVEGPTFGCYINVLHTNPNRDMAKDGAYPAQGRWTYQFICTKQFWSIYPFSLPHL